MSTSYISYLQKKSKKKQKILQKLTKLYGFTINCSCNAPSFLLTKERFEFDKRKKRIQIPHTHVPSILPYFFIEWFL